MFLFTSVVLYAVSLQLVHALPFVKRIVIDPLITSPNADTVWTPGSSELVTWYDNISPCLSVYSLTWLLGTPQLFRLRGPLRACLSLVTSPLVARISTSVSFIRASPHPSFI